MVNTDVLDYIAEAVRKGQTPAIDRGLKWQMVMHDMFLRYRGTSRT